MTRKYMNSIFSLFFVLTISIILPYTVHAETSDFGNKIVTHASSTESTRGTYLSEGTAEINVISSDEVHISGITDCARTSDKVYLYLYLEQKVNGSYNSYRVWKFTKQNADYLARGIDVLVPSGYYYRVRGYHAAECDGTKESTGTCTGGVWVD